jgi:hypothetical protein
MLKEKSAQPSVWSEGKATISILQRHIDEAMEKNSSHCATAEAIREQVKEARFVSVDLQTIRWSDANKGLRYVFLTPHAIQGDVIVPFDQGERENCKPVTVRMKPAFVTKCGKKRTHTPDPEQLKDLGLRVAAEQPHLSKGTVLPTVGKTPEESPAERTITATMMGDPGPGQSALDHRNGAGRIVPPPPHKRREPRMARAKVSAASKGVIPTTLGGKLPPVSVLSRREFGLRALRR